MVSKDKHEMKLAKLKDEMRGLAEVMRLNQRALTFDEGQEIENIQFKLEYALKELVGKTRVLEAQMKLKAMKDTLAVVKNIPIII